MPPDSRFDPQRILEVLARHQVRCVVIGGYAAVLAGIDIVTRDVDITPARAARSPPLRPATAGPHASVVRLTQAAIRQPLGGGLHIAIASLEDIIRSKTAAGRAKDLAALPQLRAALERPRNQPAAPEEE